MDNVDKAAKSIGNRLSLNDYKTEIPKEVKTETPKKAKLTVYLTIESIKKLNEICSKKILEKGKPDKSALISKAVDLLYEHENKGN